MKYLLFAITLFSLTAKAQDSSALYMPFQMKTKFAADLVPQTILPEDARLIDTLKKAMGNGQNIEMVTTIHFKVGTYLALIEPLVDASLGGYYADGTEFFTAPLTAVGYTGLLTTLDYYSGIAGPYRAAATWLKNEVYELLERKRQVILDRRTANFLRATTPIVYR